MFKQRTPFLILLGFLAVALSGSPALAQRAISLQNVWREWLFYPNTVRGISSMADGEHYTTLEQGRIIKYRYRDGAAVETLFSANNHPGIGEIDAYALSPDEKYLLLTTNRLDIYRHSFTADFMLYQLDDKTLRPLSENGAQQLATFSPTSDKLAFVRANNLFVKDLTTGQEKQITTDGVFNEIINGAPDWVYEEEFGFSKAFEWAPDGSRIAYYRFDESQVKQFNMTMYSGLYPEWYRFKYPKAGERNATVELYVHELASGRRQAIDLGTEPDQYIPRIRWTRDPQTLSFIRLNRLQNKWELLLANAADGRSRVALAEEDPRYVEVNDDLTFLPDGKHFVLTSERDGHNHIYLHSLDGNLVAQITEGDWDVTQFLGYNPDNEQVYYQSAEESPLRRGVYSIRLNGKNKKLLTPKQGTNSVEFSQNFRYFINTYSAANVPTEVTLHEGEGKLIRELEMNSQLKNTAEFFGFSRKEFIQIPNRDGLALNAWVIKPPDFDPQKQYPVFMYVYGGPGSQTVLDSWDWRLGWFQLLAQQGYIVVSVDNRGTGARGTEFKKMTYGQLGKYETQDQIDAARWLADQDWVDAKRIGIFGWSYGGYMSTLCLAQGADVFAMAIAVAPVTNWRFYDSIYTERYMGLPQDNASGYDNNSPIHHVGKIKGKFLLVHGSADDNVHMQNTMEMVTELVEEGVQFDMMIYPDKNHSISGTNTTLHIHQKLTQFIFDNL